MIMKPVMPSLGSSPQRGTVCAYSRWSFAALVAFMALLLFHPSIASAQPSYSYFDVFVDITPQGGSSTMSWFEVPYVVGTTPTLSIPDTYNVPVTLSDVGYLLSPTQIPLDQLNFSDQPPTGSPGSPFTALPQYDGSSITPGNSENISAPDQSSTLTLFSLVGVGLLASWRTLQPKRL